MLKKGFITALGTPLNDSGSILESSLKKQIYSQISAGASGILLFGTMGMGGCIKNDEFEKGINIALSAINKNCTLLVGASDNSLARVADKIEILNKYDVNGIVITPPYYFKTGDAAILNFFEKTAAMTSKDYYLYDHEPITKHKITLEMVVKLLNCDNIKGIKSGDLVLIKNLTQNPIIRDDFTPIFSGSDLFDVAHSYGIKRYLDGIFACMPNCISKVQKLFDKDDIQGAKIILKDMMKCRDEMLHISIWPAFSYAMNLLGFDGNFAPDYEPEISNSAKTIIKDKLHQLGEI